MTILTQSGATFAHFEAWTYYIPMSQSTVCSGVTVHKENQENAIEKILDNFLLCIPMNDQSVPAFSV